MDAMMVNGISSATSAHEWNEGSISLNAKMSRDGSQKVAVLMDAIKQIQATKKYLQMNSVEVKSSIHSNISRLLETLRSREVWLFNQADVLYQAKEEVLQAQEDRLNQALGALTNCLRLMESGAAVESDLIENLERICQLETRPKETPHLMFRADAVGLRESIQRFGKVDTKGLPGNVFHCRETTSGTASSSLPRQFEDYGDEEHQVLYKAIDPHQESQQGTRIVFNVPKLPDSSASINASCGTRHCASAPRLNEGEAGITTGSFGRPSSASVSASLRAAKVSTLQYYLDQEKNISQSTSNSIRQWLSELHTEESDEDGLMPTESSIAEFTRRCSIVRSESPTTVDGVTGAETNVVGEGKKEVMRSLRRIIERPLSYWASSSSATSGVKTSDAEGPKPADTLLKSVILKILSSPDTRWLRSGGPAPLVTECAKQNPPSSYKCIFRMVPNNNEQKVITTNDVKTPPYKYNFRVFQTKCDQKMAVPAAEIPSDGVNDASTMETETVIPETEKSESAVTSPMSGYMKRVHSYPDTHWLKSKRGSVSSAEISETANRLESFLHPNAKMPKIIKFHFSSPDSSTAEATRLTGETPSPVQFRFLTPLGATPAVEATQLKPAKMLFKSYGSMNLSDVAAGSVEQEKRPVGQSSSERRPRGSIDSATSLSTDLQKWLSPDSRVSTKEASPTPDAPLNPCGSLIKKMAAQCNTHWLAAESKKVDNDNDAKMDVDGSSCCRKGHWIVGADDELEQKSTVIKMTPDHWPEDSDNRSQSSSYQLVEQEEEWMHCSS